MGTFITRDPNFIFPQGNITYNDDEILDLPESFDARDEWPDCIQPIRSQGQCGGCWAFGAAEALSDRFCIASGGKINVVLSP